MGKIFFIPLSQFFGECDIDTVLKISYKHRRPQDFSRVGGKAKFLPIGSFPGGGKGQFSKTFTTLKSKKFFSKGARAPLADAHDNEVKGLQDL